MSNTGTFYDPIQREWLEVEILILQASRIHLRFVIHYAEMRLYLSALVTTWLNHTRNWKCDSSTQVDYKKTRHVEFNYKRMKKQVAYALLASLKYLGFRRSTQHRSNRSSDIVLPGFYISSKYWINYFRYLEIIGICYIYILNFSQAFSDL